LPDKRPSSFGKGAENGTLHHIAFTLSCLNHRNRPGTEKKNGSHGEILNHIANQSHQVRVEVAPTGTIENLHGLPRQKTSL
jgi:hypothetical protein